MKILVTGCAGFIGFHLAKKLLAEGHEVVGVDNINSYYSPILKLARLKQLGIVAESLFPHQSIVTAQGFTFIKSDIEDSSLYQDCLSQMNFDMVCHLAAQAGVRYSITNPQVYIHSNIQGFFQILEYCRKNPVKKLVYASSSSVYGKNSSIPFREGDRTDTPVSLYAATKKANELLAYTYSGLYGIHAIGLRFFTVYGPWGRPDMAPFLFTKAILENEPIKVFNEGNMSRDFTYIDDIVEGIYRVLINEPLTNASLEQFYRIYNIGNSQPVCLNEFISTIEDITGKKANRMNQPMQPGDVKNTWADTTQLEGDYHYKPSTSLRTGLEAFINWYQEYRKESNNLIFEYV
ncbi:MAG: NAD-dependent epimerase/dehydratase family protein [Bacteroides sp.]|nr:NAD-dependent epimerase/dehydratase family protein [Bacteroides sp.]